MQRGGELAGLESVIPLWGTERTPRVCPQVITLHAFVPNALKGAWEEAHFSWLFKRAKPRLRAMRPQISVASSSRQTAARGPMDSSPPRAEDANVSKCPAARTVEEPAVQRGPPAAPHGQIIAGFSTLGPPCSPRVMDVLAVRLQPRHAASRHAHHPSSHAGTPAPRPTASCCCVSSCCVMSGAHQGHGPVYSLSYARSLGK